MQYIYKKYGNRKIYSVNDQCYVSLGDIGTDVLNGIEPTVICFKTKRDITAEILSQVVALRRKQFLASVPSLIAELRTNAPA